jgi:hypothetical protein
MPDGDKSSHIKGWIVGYKLHMWYQDGSIVVVPLSAADMLQQPSMYRIIRSMMR